MRQIRKAAGYFVGGRRKVLGNAFIYGAGAIIQRGLGLLLLPFLTRILEVEQYGLVGTGIAISNVLSIVYNLGITFSIVRLYYDEKEAARRAEWAALVRVQIVLAFLLAGLTWALGPTWSSIFKEIEWGAALQVAVLYSLAIAVQSSAQAVLRAAQRASSYFLVSMSQTVVGTSLALALAIRYEAAGYLGGLAVGSAVAALVAISLNYRRPLWRFGAVKAGLLLSFPFVFHQLSSWMVDLSDRILIERYLGLAAVGRYQLAYTLASLILILLTSVNSAWAPHYYGDLNDEEKRLAPGVLVIPLNVVCASLSLVLVMISPLLFGIAAPDEFGSPTLVLALVAGATSVRATYFLATTILFDRKDSKSIAQASAAAAALNIGLNLVLIPSLGIPAAAAATTIAFATQTIFIVRKVRVTGVAFPLRSPALIWIVGLVTLGCLSALPTTPVGWTVRISISLCGILLAYRGVREASRAYQLVRTG